MIYILIAESHVYSAEYKHTDVNFPCLRTPEHRPSYCGLARTSSRVTYISTNTLHLDLIV